MYFVLNREKLVSRTDNVDMGPPVPTTLRYGCRPYTRVEYFRHFQIDFLWKHQETKLVH